MGVVKNPKVTYLDPIVTVSRKFTQRANTCGLANKMTGGIPAKWFGGAVLTKETKTTLHGIPRNVLVFRSRYRDSALSDDEITARSVFNQRVAWIKVRRKDLQHITQDQEDFLAQKDLPTGVKSMYAFYWKLAIEAIPMPSGN